MHINSMTRKVNKLDILTTMHRIASKNTFRFARTANGGCYYSHPNHSRSCVIGRLFDSDSRQYLQNCLSSMLWGYRNVESVIYTLELCGDKDSTVHNKTVARLQELVSFLGFKFLCDYQKMHDYSTSREEFVGKLETEIVNLYKG